jgi:hypothetical protein
MWQLLPFVIGKGSHGQVRQSRTYIERQNVAVKCVNGLLAANTDRFVIDSMIERFNLANRVNGFAFADQRLLIDKCNGRTKLGLDYCACGAKWDSAHTVTINPLIVDSASTIIFLNDTHCAAR